MTQRARLRALATRRFDRSTEVPSHFFDANAELVSQTCLAMARRFQRGGRLIVFGEGADATDAQHVAVEFVHPVIVGKRALPAIALTNDVATLTGRRRMDRAESDGASDQNGEITGALFSAMLATLGRPDDIAMGIMCAGTSSATAAALAKGRALGMLTIAIQQAPTGTNGGSNSVEHMFLIQTTDPMVAQEVGETLYHVLWELVHLFLEHGAGSVAGGTA